MRPVFFGLTSGSGEDPEDPDAAALISATGITDPTIQTAINNWFLETKMAGIYPKLHRVYLMPDDNESACKFNALDPLDLDEAGRLNFVDGWDFSAAGAKGNGFTCYADTFWNPSVELADSAHSLGIYLTEPSSLVSDTYSMGAYSAPNEFHGIQLDTSTDVYHYSFDTGSRIGRATINTSGFVQGICDGIDHQCLFGPSASAAVPISGSRPNVNFYLGALNFNGESYGHIDGRIGGAYLGEALTTAEAIAFNTIWQNYQTALSREV